MQLKLSSYDWYISILSSKKCQTPVILADLLGKESFLQWVQKVIVCDLWLVDFDPFFQCLLLVILLWPKPDVNIPNIFDRFHPWTSDFQISMRQKYWRFRLTFEIVKVRLSALCKQSFLSHMPLTLYKTFTWQTFASLHLFSSLVYVSTYCVPIAHLHQNKPFPLLYLGRTQIINIQYLLYVDRFMPRFPCLFRGKYLLENAGNGISECLGFKIFWETVPPDPPRRLLFQHNLLLKNLLKALHIHN